MDASLFALWYMGVVPASDPMAAGTMRAIEESLGRPGGGIARYVGDGYQGHTNSWPLCTLWLAQWYIRRRGICAKRLLSSSVWCAGNVAPGGLMPEQETGAESPYPSCRWHGRIRPSCWQSSNTWKPCSHNN